MEVSPVVTAALRKSVCASARVSLAARIASQKGN